jgi:hypothetical protein
MLVSMIPPVVVNRHIFSNFKDPVSASLTHVFRKNRCEFFCAGLNGDIGT